MAVLVALISFNTAQVLPGAGPQGIPGQLPGVNPYNPYNPYNQYNGYPNQFYPGQQGLYPGQQGAYPGQPGFPGQGVAGRF